MATIVPHLFAFYEKPRGAEDLLYSPPGPPRGPHCSPLTNSQGMAEDLFLSPRITTGAPLFASYEKPGGGWVPILISPDPHGGPLFASYEQPGDG